MPLTIKMEIQKVKGVYWGDFYLMCLFKLKSFPGIKNLLFMLLAI